LGVLLTILLPFSRPVYLYYALTPESKTRPLVGLNMPNMTNRAILSWATTSITEVMTIGFGDIDIRLPKQKNRFTEKGWDAYMKTFDRMKIRDAFKQNQLVLTTVPSNTPVIIGQGTNAERIYQWVVQMPIIMTYATNNNVMKKQRSTVTLTIVRVPAEENSFGIAIRNWNLG
jgi:intracellular multiplication protein IcmL